MYCTSPITNGGSLMRKLMPALSRIWGSCGPGPAASPSKIAAAIVRLSLILARARTPSAASGGEGPPLGRLTEVIAGQPSEAVGKTAGVFWVVDLGVWGGRGRG